MTVGSNRSVEALPEGLRDRLFTSGWFGFVMAIGHQWTIFVSKLIRLFLRIFSFLFVVFASLCVYLYFFFFVAKTYPRTSYLSIYVHCLATRSMLR